MSDVPPIDPSPSDAAGQVGHSATAPPKDLVRSPLSDGEWHRLHPLTPLLRGGLFLIVVIGIVIANLRDRLLFIFVPWLAPDLEDELGEWEGRGGDPIDYIFANNLALVALGAILAALLVLLGVFYFSWRFHTFRITGDEVEVRSGVLFRTHRRAPLDRVQGVNLTRPMVARLFGLGKLEVVGAGLDANVKLEYMSTTNAEEVRADILRLASGRRLAEAQGAAPSREGGGRVAALSKTVSRELTGIIEGAEEPVEAPDSVVHIPVGRLIASHLISVSTLMLIAATVAIIIGVSMGVFWLLFAFVPALIGFGAFWVRSITRSLRYSIAPTDDGVRITFGLLTTVTETIPPGRIHAIEATQPILWRAFGWWMLRVTRITGRSAADNSADQFTTVLPVGTIADVERVLALLQPSVPAEEWTLAVQQGMLGPTADDSFTNTPPRGWWIRPLSWKRNGFRITDDMLLLRRGVIWRKLAMLPLARLQSMGIQQGPLDRASRVVGLRPHVISGPIYPMIAAVDRDTALALFDDVARRTVRASADDRSHRWAVDDADAAGQAESTGAAGAADGPGTREPTDSSPTHLEHGVGWREESGLASLPDAEDPR